VVHDPLAQIERELILEYIRHHLPPKLTWESLSEAERHQLAMEASYYASVRLAVIETRAHMLEEVHGAVLPGQLG
jgi:hypothetical protein